MTVESGAVAIDLVEKDLIAPVSVERREHVEAQATGLKRDRQRGILRHQAPELFEAAVDQLECDGDGKAGSRLLRRVRIVLRRSHPGLRSLRAIPAPPGS